VSIIRNRVFSRLAEVLIAVALVAAVILYAEVGRFRWMPSVRWWGLAVITGLLFGMVANQYRPYWRRRSFWLTLGGLIAVHLCAWTLVLLRASQWGLLWFVPPGMVEVGLIVLLLDKLGFAP
jgi:hypothetical protein